MDQWLAQFTAAKEQLPGALHPALQSEREALISQAQTIGLPDRRNEAWKYTNLTALSKKEFALAADTAPVSLDEEALESWRFADLDTIELVYVNGRAQHADLPDVAGLSIATVAEWLNAGNALPRLPETDNVFAQLNSAFTSEGVVITVDEGAVIERPIHVVFINAETNQPIMQMPRVIVQTGANSQIKVIESYVGCGAAQHFTNALTHLNAGPNAQIEHYRIQDEAQQTFHIANLIIEQAADSRVVNHAVSLGAALARVDTHANLTANNAEVELNGLFMAQARQHTDQQIRIDHAHPHTRSDQFYKGVLDGHSRGVFNGKVVVHEDAQKIESAQVNKNLLLSDNAEVDTKPELEIYADDVKCAHGATIGQLDNKSLFYLQSRGIDIEKARSILTYAFADEVIERMSLEAVKHYLEKRVVGQLADDRIADLEDSL